MPGSEAHPRRAPAVTRPGDLIPGDVVILDGAPYEVLAEPFLGCTGSSIFDKAELFWRVRVRPMGGNAEMGAYATWGIDERVPRYARRPELSA
jgi:hypothetical protein